MRQFIIKISCFIAIPIAIYLIVFYFLLYKFRNTLESSPVIILGDSHTEFIRDSDIINCSFNGCPYFVHFFFTQKFISEIKNKKVLIAYNYHNLSPLYQNRLSNPKLLPNWRPYIFDRINRYNFINQAYKEVRPDDMEIDIFEPKKIPRLFREVFMMDQNTDIYIKNDTSYIQSVVDNHWNAFSENRQDTLQKKYLFKLVNYLKENGCQVSFIKMPLTSGYKNGIPDKVKEQSIDLPRILDVQLIDMDKNLNISSEYQYFKDYGHLNALGDSLVIDHLKKSQLIQPK